MWVSVSEKSTQSKVNETKLEGREGTGFEMTRVQDVNSAETGSCPSLLSLGLILVLNYMLCQGALTVGLLGPLTIRKRTFH